jgi:hypothetical protein
VSSFVSTLASAPDKRDLEAVKDPGDPKADDNQPVPATPGKPVEAARDHRLDDLARPSRVRPSPR